MKKAITLFALLLTANVFAGEFKSSILKTGDDGHLIYEEVVTVENMNKEALYNQVKIWVLANIKTGDINTFFDDKGFETIITTPTLLLDDLKWKHLHDQKVSFKLKLSFKDNKFKITTSGFIYYAIQLNGEIRTGEALENIDKKRFIPNPYAKVAEKFDESFSSFIKALGKAAIAEKTDKW